MTERERLTERIRELEKELEAARSGTEWISVNEQLPKESTNARDRVLVVVRDAFHAGDIIDTDRIYNGGWVRWGGSVTHWMPLPEDMP